MGAISGRSSRSPLYCNTAVSSKALTSLGVKAAPTDKLTDFAHSKAAHSSISLGAAPPAHPRPQLKEHDSKIISFKTNVVNRNM